MKFSIDADEFRRLVQPCAKVVPSKTTRPELEHIRLKVSWSGSVHAIATDGDITIRRFTVINHSIFDEACDMLFPAKRLKDCLEFAKGLVEVTLVDDSRAMLRCKGREYGLKVMPADEFPEIPEASIAADDDNIIGTFDDGALKRALTFVKDSVSRDEYRPAMRGVYFDLRKVGSARFVATDSYCLAKYDFTDDEFTRKAQAQSFMLPGEVIPLLSTLDGLVNVVGISELKSDNDEDGRLTHVQFSDGLTEITVRIVDEKFPPYESILPNNFTDGIEFSRRALLTAVKSVAKFANERSKTLCMEFGDGICTLTTNDEDGAVYSAVAIECKYDGEIDKIGLNHKFLTKSLTALTGCDTVVMRLNSVTKPIVLQNFEADLSTSCRLIMPINLANEESRITSIEVTRIAEAV